MARNNSDKSSRPEAYPKPTETDVQLQNQPEYMDQQPNTYEKDISNMPANNDIQPDEKDRRNTK